MRIDFNRAWIEFLSMSRQMQVVVGTLEDIAQREEAGVDGIAREFGAPIGNAALDRVPGGSQAVTWEEVRSLAARVAAMLNEEIYGSSASIDDVPMQE